MSDNDARCGHASCRCTVPSGSEYCSDYCREAAATTPEEQTAYCDCGHEPCVQAKEASLMDATV
ncbi:hypothetical protein [Frateuria defendens]|uniref:hypothetical protein n=1 Tax=Frateuria defendens TaxID=2219559 RepID=UPI00066FC5FB|nr:hypothetical protein [Frateuria defendens]